MWILKSRSTASQARHHPQSEESRESIRALTPKRKTTPSSPSKITGDVGPTVSREILKFFASEAGQHVLARMDALGIHPQSNNHLPIPAQADTSDLPYAGKTVVITGTLSISRDEMKAWLEARGAKVSGSISAKTSFLLCGENGGSKHDKAESQHPHPHRSQTPRLPVAAIPVRFRNNNFPGKIIIS